LKQHKPPDLGLTRTARFALPNLALHWTAVIGELKDGATAEEIQDAFQIQQDIKRYLD
jgi:hypothetical protein